MHGAGEIRLLARISHSVPRFLYVLRVLLDAPTSSWQHLMATARVKASALEPGPAGRYAAPRAVDVNSANAQTLRTVWWDIGEVYRRDRLDDAARQRGAHHRSIEITDTSSSGDKAARYGICVR